MATDVVTESDRPAKNTAELLAFIKKELDADAERHAKLHASGAGELLHESQTGVTLDLGHKNLRALPLEVIGLIKDKVERLALSHNPQIVVPPQIAQCERLRYLNIRWNQLVHFPDAVLQLTKLEILDLSKNRITAIPEGIKKLTSLKFLAVSRNRITRLPYALGEMNSLGKLKFDENPIEFPPPEALKLSLDTSTSSFEAEREKDICQKVKRYLRTAAVKEKLKPVSEEDLSESNAETPRPPKRPVTAGRFPIRPSISGLESTADLKVDSTSEQQAPPIPQRSHIRNESSNEPLLKRPGIAPLLTGGNDISRSQSETVSASASLRQRRQGFVPKRKPVGNLDSVTELSTRLKQAEPVNPTHSRAASSISSLNGFLVPSTGNTTGASSPVSTRFDNIHLLPSLPGYRNLKTEIDGFVKGSKRLVLTLCQLERPINDVACTVKGEVLCKSSLERQLFTAQARLKDLDRLLSGLESVQEDDTKTYRKVTRAIIRASMKALKSYGAVTAELRRKRDLLVHYADGVYLRGLMFKIHGAMVEARNICTALGFNVKEAAEPEAPMRVSQAWSSKSVTPTQPKAHTLRRPVKPAMVHTVGNAGMRRLPPPPGMPLSANVSRTNTMTSQTSTLMSSIPALSRTNTMRSGVDEGEGDEQFDKIFLKLQAACNLATQALPHCRTEFQSRKDMAQSAGERIVAHHWSMALNKCDEVIYNNKALKKRLELVKVNDPGLRHQREFWQLCDAFVHSWAEFATEIKELSSQRMDISTIKQVMRNVQRHVKDVSKTIFSSPLYHAALGKGHEPGITTNFSSPFPSPYKAPHQSNGFSHSHGGYVTPVPATPFSAALGPAVQATLTTPNVNAVPQEYLQEPLTARTVRDRDRDRNDTPMQPSYARRY